MDCSAQDNATVTSMSPDHQMLLDHRLDETFCTLQHARAQLLAEMLCCMCTDQNHRLADHSMCSLLPKEQRLKDRL